MLNSRQIFVLAVRRLREDKSYLFRGGLNVREIQSARQRRMDRACTLHNSESKSVQIALPNSQRRAFEFRVISVRFRRSSSFFFFIHMLYVSFVYIKIISFLCYSPLSRSPRFRHQPRSVRPIGPARYADVYARTCVHERSMQRAPPRKSVYRSPGILDVTSVLRSAKIRTEERVIGGYIELAPTRSRQPRVRIGSRYPLPPSLFPSHSLLPSPPIDLLPSPALPTEGRARMRVSAPLTRKTIRVCVCAFTVVRAFNMFRTTCTRVRSDS